MKKLFILLLLVVPSFMMSKAQPASGKLETFRTQVLPAYSTYFGSADLTEGGHLHLTALDSYIQLSPSARKSVMDNLLKSWQEPLVMVSYGSVNELWGRDTDGVRSLLLDSWDSNPRVPESKPATTKTPAHPWFCYAGYHFQYDSEKNINLALNTRIGFFLLLNRWDLAVTFTGSAFGNVDADPAVKASLGLMSRVYFPIPELKISPNIGGNLAWESIIVNDEITKKATPSLLTGISWFVGPGSFDIGVTINKEPTVMVGYTFVPAFRK